MGATAVREEQHVVQQGWLHVNAHMQNTGLYTQNRFADVWFINDPWNPFGRTLYSFVIDDGTRVAARSDIRLLLAATVFAPTEIQFEPQPRPLVPMTRMARIRALADLSLREWASVFGVTHTAIKDWQSVEPARDKVGQVLEAIEDAARYHSDLGQWLRCPIPGTDLAPLELLKRDSWRAFRGALAARTAPPVTISADELRQRRQADESWAIPEIPIVTTD